MSPLFLYLSHAGERVIVGTKKQFWVKHVFSPHRGEDQGRGGILLIRQYLVFVKGIFRVDTHAPTYGGTIRRMKMVVIYFQIVDLVPLLEVGSRKLEVGFYVQAPRTRRYH